MEIQTNTDSTIERHAALTDHVKTVVTEALGRYHQQITRVVVHLGQGKDAKSANGVHRCMMEAHVKTHAPVVATEYAASLHQAIHGAAEKLKRALGTTLGKSAQGAKGGDRIVDGIVDDQDSA